MLPAIMIMLIFSHSSLADIQQEYFDLVKKIDSETTELNNLDSAVKTTQEIIESYEALNNSLKTRIILFSMLDIGLVASSIILWRRFISGS
ncbi:MAG: hypothetical protein ACE5K4_05455 [Candidatus Hydrothermarchaeota archaeon]